MPNPTSFSDTQGGPAGWAGCRRRSGTALLLIGCAGLLLAPAGCGGSKPSPANAPSLVLNLEKPKPAAARPGENAAKSSAAPAAGSRKSGGRSGNRLSSGGDDRLLEAGDGLFAVVSDPQEAGPRYAVSAPVTDRPRDHFAVTPLARNVDSSRFTVLPIPESATGDSTGAGDAAGRYEAPGRGFTPLPGAGLDPSGLPLRMKCEADGSVMALVAPGVFVQGKDSGPAEVRPQHSVFLDAYYIDIHEITFEQYEAYRKSRAEEKKRVTPATVTAANPKEPVRGVNWGEAQQYAHWAGKELPTEAQWEKAARGPEGFDYPWGNGRYLWHRPRVPGQIDPVGDFQGDRSPCGAFDMAGNVREWCLDWYIENAYEEAISHSDAVPRNPAGPKLASASRKRVVKGGDPRWRVWTRAGEMLTDRPEDAGFRCVRELRLIPVAPTPPARATKKAGEKAAR